MCQLIGKEKLLGNVLALGAISTQGGKLDHLFKTSGQN